MKSTLFMVNIVLNTKMKRLIQEIEILKDTLQRLQIQKATGNLYPHRDQEIQLPKPRRKRKKKSEVERNFSCNIDNCQKSYGSENSLNQHMKIKHPEFWRIIKEQEQSLLNINNYNITDPRFENPQLLFEEMSMGRNRVGGRNVGEINNSNQFSREIRENNELRFERRLKMNPERIEEVSDSEDTKIVNNESDKLEGFVEKRKD